MPKYLRMCYAKVCLIYVQYFGTILHCSMGKYCCTVYNYGLHDLLISLILLQTAKTLEELQETLSEFGLQGEEEQTILQWKKAVEDFARGWCVIHCSL